MEGAGRWVSVLTDRVVGRTAVAFGIVLAVLASTSCTRESVLTRRLRNQSDSASTSTSTDRTADGAADGDGAEGGEAALVVSSWFAAERAFDSAALTADPEQPDLLATTTAPQLGATEALLEEMQADGDVARGVAHYGTPTVRVLSPDLAEVTSCLHDAEIVVNAATGQPVPGVEGEVAFELLRSTMQLLGGGWKLASQTVGVDQCSG